MSDQVGNQNAGILMTRLINSFPSVDVDECDLDDPKPDCGNNSRCSNTLGSYDCPCCQGYEKENDTCVGKCVLCHKVNISALMKLFQH